MAVVVEVDEIYVEEPPPSIGWGWFLGAGIAWFVLGLAILSVHPTAIAIISFLVAGVVILAGLMELAMAFVSTGWRWLHFLAAAIFLVAGILAFMKPFQTFVGLAILFGWYLVIKGMVVLIASIAMRAPGSLWGLGVTVGVLYLAIGLWAIGYPDRSAWLLVLWIGIGALLHGMWDIVRSFEYRSARRP
jgi:uncharacterized membrane protein HdeD (DUF308 family)